MFDALEAAGHDLTMLCPIHAGISIHYCEHCGAVIQSYQGRLCFFHVPPGIRSTEGECIGSYDRETGPIPRFLRERLGLALAERMFKGDDDDDDT